LTQGIAEAGKPLELQFEGFGTQHREFRFFCALIKPTDALRQLYGVVHRTIPSVADETFVSWPHASLLYGTAASQAKYPDIEPLVERFGGSLNVKHRADEITLWNTNGPVDDWKQLAAYALGGQR
jgi:2'-5' RNA ligase